MTENREKGWQELEAKVRHILNNPRLLPKDLRIKQFTQTLHLWISPTFTPEIHWTFYKPNLQINPQPNPIIQQMIWRKDADYQRLNNPLIGLQEGFHTEPTFEIKTIEIEKELFDKIHKNLAKIQIPPFMKDEILGLDGEHFGVETLGSYHSAKISWWSSYPKEWQSLIDWFEKTIAFVEKKFDESS